MLNSGICTGHGILGKIVIWKAAVGFKQVFRHQDLFEAHLCKSVASTLTTPSGIIRNLGSYEALDYSPYVEFWGTSVVKSSSQVYVGFQVLVFVQTLLSAESITFRVDLSFIWAIMGALKHWNFIPMGNSYNQVCMGFVSVRNRC